MEGKNYNFLPVIIVGGTLITLMGISGLQSKGLIHLPFQRNFDALADLKEPVKTRDAAGGKTAGHPVAPANNSMPLPSPVPDENVETYKGIIDYGINDNGNTGHGFIHFLKALADLKAGKRKTVRIAYFGDSMIEGDLISKELRDSLQVYFGGGGVGFIPITSVVSSFRNTIIHTYSNDWTDHHLKTPGVDFSSLGISGHVFIPANGSTVHYAASAFTPRLNHFHRIGLLYGPSEGGSVSINGTPYALSGTERVNEVAYTPTGDSKTINITASTTTPLYGVTFDDASGVSVDNFSFRGTSGLELGRLSRDMLQAFATLRQYDLIIFQYGPNILFKPELTNFDSWFARPMARTWNLFKTAFPNTAMLEVGTADKSYRSGGSWITAPGVTALLAVQDSMARENGAAFWSLYANMGGSGSMTQWAEQPPVKANKDYTHLNFRGAALVGGMLYHAILKDFEAYELKQNKQSVVRH